jgi:hypothetical protein
MFFFSSVCLNKRQKSQKTIKNYGFTHFSVYVFREEMGIEETLNPALANSSRI